MDKRASIWPGLLFSLAIALAAGYLHELPFPPFSIGGARHPIDSVLIAILLGIAVRNTVPLPSSLGPGIKYAVVSLLPMAIVLMGAKLDFFDVLRISGHALVISVTCVILALSLTLWLCRRTRVGQKLGLLIGVGTAICGGTAIVVVAPIIEADDNDTAFAITTITLFGLVSIAVLPALGSLLGMSQTSFGIWAGTSIHSTPQVVAAGIAYGTEAGEVAVIVKLVRVLLLAPLAVGIGFWYAKQKRQRLQAHVTQRPSLATLFPPFIFGFLALALANTLHLLPDFTLHLKESFLWQAGAHPMPLSKLAADVSTLLITMSMAGVGVGVHLRSLLAIGLKGLYVGVFSAVVLAGVSLALISASG
jgi:uncharacterized integral membrane protein (TIGR00698 family)